MTVFYGSAEDLVVSSMKFVTLPDSDYPYYSGPRQAMVTKYRSSGLPHNTYYACTCGVVFDGSCVHTRFVDDKRYG